MAAQAVCNATRAQFPALRRPPTAGCRTAARAAPPPPPARPPLGGSSTVLRGARLPAHRTLQPAAGRRHVAAQASYRNSGPDIPDRVVASLPYLFPSFGTILLPLDPIIRLYYSFPLASLIVFFGVYLGIINNPRFSRYVRFNAMQAILLDIILILPGLLESIFRPPMGGPGLQLYITTYNSIFLFLFACVAYGVGSCLVGQTARLPLVADAADAQVR
ncbi:hypothetical protein CHLNCDRAFT_136015 [Chlorella variabilis]|uniref:Protein TIC 20 n=1 Tax=Chlorella variabilis TaxID=554065 RepID=E1ZJJ8_CHLVA|nr:hypothetical protein CHLNCDRAFT_136015 [Chlorella variabilis]EFN53875.1 hypothetical protein CHLNCDRAFT_136015 [Chlorella variabilis]|eukprot:XP_005845977.1 hypothetical protein CHLNCDRAFT_136015 [Chlorella variabilis]